MRRNIALTIVIPTILAWSAAAFAGLPSTKVRYDNGLQAIFVENHSSPMITSIVFVNAGARYENEFTNGSTHFLEHLLFDGTETMSQEQLDDKIEMHGGYINAFTRKDLTAYLVLMPTEYIEDGFDVQSGQLFHSIIPEDKMGKERKIVIEEIRQSNDRISDIVNDFHQSVVYAGTPYARPVLGYENLIQTMTRDEILKYYQTWYAPNNMIALVIGDFDTDQMIETYRKYYGSVPPRKIPPPPTFTVDFPETQKIVTRSMEKADNVYINISARAPIYSDADYFAFYLLNDLLNNDGVSPLLKQINSRADLGIQSVNTGLYTQKDFTTFDMSITADSTADPNAILQAINGFMANDVASWKPNQSDLDADVISEKTNEIYLREKLHYYGFMIAPLMVATGYDFVDNLTGNLAKVKSDDVARVAQAYLSPFNYVATVVTPQGKKQGESGPTKITSSYVHDTLDNGLEVIIKSNPYSEVQAFMVLGKDRCASEPPGKAGITDFVNRMLTKGSTTHSKEEISRELTSIGGNLTVSDNPYIPYDDRYTKPMYSFLKFETIDDFTDRGIALLTELLQHATMPEDEVENVRKEMMGVLGMQSSSTRDQARDLFYGEMFPNQPYAQPIMGSMRSIGSISAQDLRDYYTKYYAPDNIILTVCTDLPPADMLAKIKSAFGNMTPQHITKAPVTGPIKVKGEVAQNVPMESKQAFIYLGGPVCGSGDPDAVALQVAVSILSDRLRQHLREEQGLAYSIGAGLNLDSKFGWYYAAMGTGTENYARAKQGIIDQIGKMRDSLVGADELEKAVNSIWGSQLMARLSRINQAFYMAVDQFIDGDYKADDDLLTRMKKLTPADIKAVADKYFDTTNYVLATVAAPVMQ